MSKGEGGGGGGTSYVLLFNPCLAIYSTIETQSTGDYATTVVNVVENKV